MVDILKSVAFLLVLLNPFLVIIYLIDLVQKMETKKFRRVLLRAGIISSSVFCIFAILGDAVFQNLIQAEFASFQIFGGIVFLIIGLQFVFRGPTAIELLRGESEHVAGAIAMPILIGPGTISASIVVGKRHEPAVACIITILSVTICIAVMSLLKTIHDYVRTKNEGLIQRYIEIAGRVTALLVGTISVDMIMQGLQVWMNLL